MERTESLRERARVLENLKEHLKSRFCGIDEQIDIVVEYMRPWFLMPELQRRPTVISLWGLTGTGKTTLVKAIAEFLDKELMDFDMGEYSDRSRSSYVRNFSQGVSNFATYERMAPIVLLDDIHKVRTLNPMGEDIDRPSVASLWDFISEGTVYYDAANAEYLMQDLENMIEGDDAMASSYWHVVRVSLTLLGINRSQDKEDFRKKFREDPKKVAEEILERLRTVKVQAELDFSNALIFLTGNLDELFGMDEAFSANPDLTPDDLHEWSLGLTVPRAKESLLRMFRPEQVGRMGNNHVIYPAFSAKGLRDVIELGLQENANAVFNTKGVSLVFDDSIRDIIYQEGVFPTQGARPLVSTLNRLLQSSLPDALIAAEADGVKMIEMSFDVDRSVAIFKPCASKDVCPRLTEVPVSLVIDTLRKPTYDGEKATLAIHEAGHVVNRLVEMGQIPLRASVFSTQSPSKGFVQNSGKREALLSAEELMGEIVSKLGGAAAERFVFGDNMQTLGSGMDLRHATDLAKNYVLVSGFGNVISSRAYHPETDQILIREEQEDMIEHLLAEAESKAWKNVSENAELLARLAAEILTHKFIGPADIKKVVEEIGFEMPQKASRTDIYEKFASGFGIAYPAQKD